MCKRALAVADGGRREAVAVAVPVAVPLAVAVEVAVAGGGRREATLFTYYMLLKTLMRRRVARPRTVRTVRLVGPGGVALCDKTNQTVGVRGALFGYFLGKQKVT